MSRPDHAPEPTSASGGNQVRKLVHVLRPMNDRSRRYQVSAVLCEETYSTRPSVVVPARSGPAYELARKFAVVPGVKPDGITVSLLFVDIEFDMFGFNQETHQQILAVIFERLDWDPAEVEVRVDTVPRGSAMRLGKVAVDSSRGSDLLSLIRPLAGDPSRDDPGVADPWLRDPLVSQDVDDILGGPLRPVRVAEDGAPTARYYRHHYGPSSIPHEPY